MSFDKEESLHSLSQISINYIFFGFYFIFIALIHLYHVFLIEPQVTFSRYFFFLYAFMQCAIETLLLVLFANAIKIFFRDKAMALYSIVVFFLNERLHSFFVAFTGNLCVVIIKRDQFICK